jgi:hypothetical protein
MTTDAGGERNWGEVRSMLVAAIMEGVSLRLAKEALPSECFMRVWGFGGGGGGWG